MPESDIHATARYFLDHNPEEIKAELLNARQYQPVSKDIIIIVHDQLDCVTNCLTSLRRTTQDYKLFLWDNGSQPETADYLRKVADEERAHLHRSEQNVGFLIPNNKLVTLGNSPYIILLNSDTILRAGWADTMIAWLQTHPDIAAVGCLGGLLDEKMVGVAIGGGYNIDYLCGWCLCFPRTTFEKFGLFDEAHLEFAYGEDSDFSLRLKEAGQKIYAMYCDLVLHLGARTALVVVNERDMASTFSRNHEYLAKRYKSYSRILSQVQSQATPPQTAPVQATVPTPAPVQAIPQIQVPQVEAVPQLVG